MKRTYNKMVHLVGYGFFVFGFLLVVRAAGLADNEGILDEIMRCAASGGVAVLGGFALTRWHI